MRRTGAALLLAGLASLAACEGVLEGPFGVGDGPFVEGRWSIDALAMSSSCGPVRDEPFGARVFQNRDILQLVVEVDDFGDVRYDGRLDRDGDFSVRQVTIFPDAGLRDESTVEGRFSASGNRLSGIEDERIDDLITGETCRIVWRWEGRRR
jgi:hypothetical protein